MISQAQKQYQAILVIATRINPRLNRDDLEAILGAIGIKDDAASDAVAEAIRVGVLVWENHGYAPGPGLDRKKGN